MFLVIALVAWAMIGLPIFYSIPIPADGIWRWMTGDVAGFFTFWLVVVGAFQVTLFSGSYGSFAKVWKTPKLLLTLRETEQPLLVIALRPKSFL